MEDVEESSIVPNTTKEELLVNDTEDDDEQDFIEADIKNSGAGIDRL